MLYWNIGRRIHEEILHYQRAEYDEKILPTLSAKLVEEYWNGYSEWNLKRMIDFADRFPEPEIVATLSQELSWSHFNEIIY